MSFSSSVKDELSRQMPGARHCQIAETAAILKPVRKGKDISLRPFLD